MNNVLAAAGKTLSVTEYKFALRLTEVENRPQPSPVFTAAVI